MDNSAWLLLAVFVIGLTSLVGFFVTKARGFGRFATSTFLLLLVILLSALMYVGNKLDAPVLANIFFAVIGFAGGLFTKGEESASSKNGALDPSGKLRPLLATSDVRDSTGR